MKIHAPGLRVLALLFAASLPLSLATATETASPVRQSPVPLLWKVSDADNALYLLGSFHLLRPDDYPLSEDVDAAFADAESLLFELSPEEMNSPALPALMLQAGQPRFGSLHRQVRTGSRATCSASTARTGVPRTRFSTSAAASPYHN